MFGLFTKLFAKNRTANTARTARRASLNVECLEDRVVPTTAALFPTSLSSSGFTLSIANMQPGHTIQLQCEATNGNEMQVLDNGNLVSSFNKESINVVEITGLANNQVVVNDSNGMPFAQQTQIYLSGGISTLSLQGSRTVAGNEFYFVGAATGSGSDINLDNLTFTLNGIPKVVDEIAITGDLDVETSGTSVQLASYGPGGQQYLTGLGSGGGGTLGYSGKPAVTLETFAPNASVFLDAPDAAVGESSFSVNMHAAGATTTIDETPKNVVTTANAEAANASVALWGNFGPVNINGNASTAVNIGYPLTSTGPVTRGIEANVTVQGASNLIIDDTGNVSTPENVTVNEFSVSGTGLFGNNAVVDYYSVASVDLFAGRLADEYTVEGDGFTSGIQITDEFSSSFRTDVYVNPDSHLNLAMWNDTTQLAELFIHTVDLTAINNPAEGIVDLLFANEFSGQVDYLGYNVSIV